MSSAEITKWVVCSASLWPNHEKHSYLPSSLTGEGCQPLKPVCEPETERCTDGSADKLVQFRSRPVSFLYLAAGLLTTSCPTGLEWSFFPRFSLNGLFPSEVPKSGFVVLHAMWLHVEYMAAHIQNGRVPSDLFIYIEWKCAGCLHYCRPHEPESKPAGFRLDPNSQRTEAHRQGVARPTWLSLGYHALDRKELSLATILPIAFILTVAFDCS